MARLARARPGQYKRWLVKAAVIVVGHYAGITLGENIPTTGVVNAGSYDS